MKLPTDMEAMAVGQGIEIIAENRRDGSYSRGESESQIRHPPSHLGIGSEKLALEFEMYKNQPNIDEISSVWTSSPKAYFSGTC